MNPLAATRPVDLLPGEPSWGRARQWLAYASKFEECKLRSQVMLGFELIALHRQLQVRNGARTETPKTDLSQNGKGWVDLIESELRIRHTTAYRFMEMSRAVAEKKLQPFAIISGIDLATTPISALTFEQSAALSTAVRRICDQRTQRDFLEDLGLADSAAEARAKGGDNEWKKWVRNHHPELLNDLGMVPTRGQVKRAQKVIWHEWELHQAKLEADRRAAQPTLTQRQAEAEARLAQTLVRLREDASDEVAGLCSDTTLKAFKQSLLGALDYLRSLEKARKVKL